MQKRTPPSGRYWDSYSSLFRASGKLPTLFRAISFLRRMRVFLERELSLAFLTGRVEVLNVALASSEVEKRGLDAPDAWAQYMEKYIGHVARGRTLTRQH